MKSDQVSWALLSSRSVPSKTVLDVFSQMDSRCRKGPGNDVAQPRHLFFQPLHSRDETTDAQEDKVAGLGAESRPASRGLRLNSP